MIKEIGSPYPEDPLPPPYYNVEGVYMTMDDIVNQRRELARQLDEVSQGNLRLSRQLDAARRVNQDLSDTLARHRRLLDFYDSRWSVRLDKWMRAQWHKFHAWSWRVRDAWEVLNGRYPG